MIISQWLVFVYVEIKHLNFSFHIVWQCFLFKYVVMGKWMIVPDMGYVIACRYNVILVLLSLKQNITFFPLRRQPPIDSSLHHIICIGHVNGNHFINYTLSDCHCDYVFYNLCTYIWLIVVLYQGLMCCGPHIVIHE